jgi:hypothetical protein
VFTQHVKTALSRTGSAYLPRPVPLIDGCREASLSSPTLHRPSSQMLVQKRSRTDTIASPDSQVPTATGMLNRGGAGLMKLLTAYFTVYDSLRSKYAAEAMIQKRHRNGHFSQSQLPHNGFRGRVSQVRILPGPLSPSSPSRVVTYG